MDPSLSKKATTIDWEQARKRLADFNLDSAKEQRRSSQEAQAILEQRARRLAQVPAPLLKASEVLEALTFLLAGERYALATAFIRQVQRPDDITPVPSTPAILLGITNWRGQILPVFNLSGALGLANASPAEPGRLLILGAEAAEFGVLTEPLLEVAQLRREDILEAPPQLAAKARELIQGVTAAGLIILHGPALLADPRFFITQHDNSAASLEGARA